MLLETARLRIEAVQHPVLGAHPDGAGGIGLDGADNPSAHGMLAVIRTIDGICIVAVQPHVQAPVVRADPDISFRVRVQVRNIIGGKRFAVRIGADNVALQPFALDIDPDAHLRTDPVLPGTALQQGKHAPATALGTAEDAFLAVVLRIHHPHVFRFVHEQQQAVGNTLDNADTVGPLLAETVRAMLVAVQFTRIGSAPGRAV